MKFRTLSLLLSAAFCLLSGCGSGVSSGLATDPASPSVVVGERLEISLVSEDSLLGEPEWEVLGLHGGGLLASRGRTVTYLAPHAAGTYRLAARCQRADGSPARLIQTIQVLPQARIEPPSANLRGGAALAFTTRIKGLPRGTVAWKVEDSESGTITAEGLYTAPARPGVYRVSATSTEDPSVVLTALVTVY